jgi:hypothetical protein
MGLHAFQDAIEIFRCDVDKAPLFELFQWLLRLTAKVAENAHYEGEFLQLNRVSYFDFVGNLHPWRTDTLEFLVYTFSASHIPLLPLSRDGIPIAVERSFTSPDLIRVGFQNWADVRR